MLALNYLEITFGKEPNFEAARAHLKTLSEEQCLQALRASMGGSDPQEGLSAADYLGVALERVQEAWEGLHRYCFLQMCIRGKRVLLGGGTVGVVWGGPAGCAIDFISLFENSGMAKAAGFEREE